MTENYYKRISEFTCCGKRMVTVIIKDKAACVMTESEYNRIIKAERINTNKKVVSVA